MGELVHPSHEEFVLSVSRQMGELVHAAAEGKILSLVAVREILWRLNSLKEIERDPDMLFPVGIDSESDSFPLGQERQYWAADSLRERDEAANRYESKVRDKVISSLERLAAKLAKLRAES
jgi:hypothetical protein